MKDRTRSYLHWKNMYEAEQRCSRHYAERSDEAEKKAALLKAAVSQWEHLFNAAVRLMSSYQKGGA